MTKELNVGEEAIYVKWLHKEDNSNNIACFCRKMSTYSDTWKFKILESKKTLLPR